MPGDGALDERLRRAAALVFVDDLAAPEPDDEAVHHLRDVLRLRAGESVAVSDGRGSWRTCLWRGTTHRGDRGALETAGPLCAAVAPAVPVTVGFALQKGDRPDWTVQKLTECGVDAIVPLLTARTVVRLDAAGRRRRGDRLRRIAREAAAQARRTVLPAVSDPLPLDACPQLAEGAPHPAAFAEPGGGPLGTTRTLFVGPEGGWTPEELAAASGHVDLGPFVLRAETAALVAGVLLARARDGFTETASAE